MRLHKIRTDKDITIVKKNNSTKSAYFPESSENMA